MERRKAMAKRAGVPIGGQIIDEACVFDGVKRLFALAKRHAGSIDNGQIIAHVV